MNEQFFIKEAAVLSGLTTKNIRDYEKSGLITAHRTDNGYRIYDDVAVARLQFIKRAREATFSLAQIRALLALRDNPNRESRQVKALLDVHLQTIREKIVSLQKTEEILMQLQRQCTGDKQSKCAIIEGLEASGGKPFSEDIAKHLIS